METATTTSAVAAEKECFIKLLESARNDFTVKVVTTDGHLGIAKYMREKMSGIVVHNQVSLNFYNAKGYLYGIEY